MKDVKPTPHVQLIQYLKSKDNKSNSKRACFKHF